MPKPNTIRKFEIIASILVVVAMAAMTYYMIREVDAGHFSLWPYAMFAVFVAGVFFTYGIISRDIEESRRFR